MTTADVKQTVRAFGGRRPFADFMAESTRTVAAWERRGITGDLATGVRLAVADAAKTRELAAVQRMSVMAALREDLRDQAKKPGQEFREGIASYRRTGKRWVRVWGREEASLLPVWRWYKDKRRRGGYPLWQGSLMLCAWGPGEDEATGRRYYGRMLEGGLEDWMTDIPINSKRHRSVDLVIRDLQREVRMFSQFIVVESQLVNFRRARKVEQEKWWTRKERERRRRQREA